MPAMHRPATHPHPINQTRIEPQHQFPGVWVTDRRRVVRNEHPGRNQRRASKVSSVSDWYCVKECRSERRVRPRVGINRNRIDQFEFRRNHNIGGDRCAEIIRINPRRSPNLGVSASVGDRDVSAPLRARSGDSGRYSEHDTALARRHSDRIPHDALPQTPDRGNRSTCRNRNFHAAIDEIHKIEPLRIKIRGADPSSSACGGAIIAT
mmetsp:Transcript_58775/g.68691  ORF Transcript_58775/g.68691 Transcript_58775/m.68691 type:complete len:208 (-) Transcript_58775:2475-3098(-)